MGVFNDTVEFDIYRFFVAFLESINWFRFSQTMPSLVLTIMLVKLLSFHLFLAYYGGTNMSQ